MILLPCKLIRNPKVTGLWESVFHRSILRFIVTVAIRPTRQFERRPVLTQVGAKSPRTKCGPPPFPGTCHSMPKYQWVCSDLDMGDRTAGVTRPPGKRRDIDQSARSGVSLLRYTTKSRTSRVPSVGGSVGPKQTLPPCCSVAMLPSVEQAGA